MIVISYQFFHVYTLISSFQEATLLKNSHATKATVKTETFTLLVAGQEGLEPPAPGFGTQCSTIGATALHELFPSCEGDN